MSIVSRELSMNGEYLCLVSGVRVINVWRVLRYSPFIDNSRLTRQRYSPYIDNSDTTDKAEILSIH
jgi:hypothetical protein